MQRGSKVRPMLYKQAISYLIAGLPMITYAKERLAIRENYKLVSESGRLKVSFVGMKARSDNLIDTPYLQFEYLW